MKLKVRILTPDGIMFDRDDVDEVILPTSTGQIGILPQHTNLLTGLIIGVLRMRIDETWIPFISLGGTASIADNSIQIMLTMVEEISTLTIEEATKELDSCRKELENTQTKKEKLGAEQNYQKAYARVQGIIFMNSINK
mmetsp:Transcript_7952/g.27068  ORF Transcript_7952/g.27068 Transcript_7952/m.27068 type:complete len:139 (+) Transcript_7952:1035-1451(+)